MKTNILSDGELLDILENSTFSSDEDFSLDSNDDLFHSDFDGTDLEISNLPYNDYDNLDSNSVNKNSLSYNENEYNWFTDSPIVENISFMGTAGLKCIPKGD